jgi:hypothetical protein
MPKQPGAPVADWFKSVEELERENEDIREVLADIGLDWDSLKPVLSKLTGRKSHGPPFDRFA